MNGLYKLELDEKKRLVVYCLTDHETKQSHFVLAYSLEEAMKRIARDSRNYLITVNGNVYFESLLNDVELKDSHEKTVKESLTKEQFLQGLSLAANELIKIEKDKRSLKRILERATEVQYNESK